MAQFTYLEDEEKHELSFQLDPLNNTLTFQERTVRCDGRSVEIEGRRIPFWVHREEDRVSVWLDGEVYRFTADDPRRRKGSGADAGATGGTVKAQMPGKVLQVAVKEGDRVEAGDNLLLMESMKMELALDASVSGTVKIVNVKPEQMVSQGEVLVEIEEQE